ncbi:nuclear transport factor 2 family protein [Streptomyces sp. NPDC014882]|uniref:nuclear transport factor 2 family protein n=1 Tax=Streptomyces sp. NPDC014882 TaxID=3364927 RepID=UPI003701046F
MSWTRGILPALAVCVLLVTGSAGCGTGGAPAPAGRGSTPPPSPVGKVLDDTDDDGRHYREIGGKGAPQVRLEVEPDAEGGWDVRLKLRGFRLSPSGARAAVGGRGIARIFVDGSPLADLRDPSYRIPEGYLAHGTHQVTARLYADDGTVWAVDGKPVESTADITASEPEAEPQTRPEAEPQPGAGTGTGSGARTEPEAGTRPESGPEAGTGPEPEAGTGVGSGSPGGPDASSPAALSAPATLARTEGRGSPDRGGKAS